MGENGNHLTLSVIDMTLVILAIDMALMILNMNLCGFVPERAFSETLSHLHSIISSHNFLHMIQQNDTETVINFVPEFFFPIF